MLSWIGAYHFSDFFIILHGPLETGVVHVSATGLERTTPTIPFWVVQ